MLLDTEKWFDILQNNGCRITAPRRAVVEALKGDTHALTPVEVYE